MDLVNFDMFKFGQFIYPGVSVAFPLDFNDFSRSISNDH